MTLSWIPAVAKKRLHDVAALILEYAGVNGETVVEARSFVRAHGRGQRAGLRLRRPVNDFRDTRVDERADTHQARLDGDVHGGAVQAVVPNRGLSLAKRHNLCVRRRIVGTNRLVVAGPHDASIHDNNRSDGHLTRRLGLPRLLERRAHERFVHTPV
jgi:hypothetical protein